MSSLTFASEKTGPQKIDSSLHSCKKCSYITKSMFFMLNHSKRHRSTFSPIPFDCSKSSIESFLCKDCNFKTFGTVAFREHIRDHRFSRQVTFETVAFSDHIKNHHFSRQVTEDKSQEEFEFSRSNALELTHERDGHSNSFSSKNLLNDVIVIDDDDSSEKCELVEDAKKSVKHLFCKNSSSNALELNHESFECDSSSSFNSKNILDDEVIFIEDDNNDCELVQHAKKSDKRCKSTSEKNIKWFECDECSYKSIDRSNWRRHVYIVHTSVFKVKWLDCSNCSYRSKDKDNLNNHIYNVHRSAENFKYFQCDKCMYKAKRRSSLRNHIMSKHTSDENIKWFECNKCPYKSKDQSNLRRHNKYTHS